MGVIKKLNKKKVERHLTVEQILRYFCGPDWMSIGMHDLVKIVNSEAEKELISFSMTIQEALIEMDKWLRSKPDLYSRIYNGKA